MPMQSTNGLAITWLGQSGFLLETEGTRLACDLYLSDYCRQRSKLDHTRLMPIPVQPEALPPIDHYLITHAHIDHFDPLTVGPVLRAQPDTMFYCPPTGERVIGEFFDSERKRFSLVSSRKEFLLHSGIRLIALPAAHEELEKDSSGEYISFSYLLLFDALKQAVFLAGDTIPYAEQDQLIRKSVPEGYELILILPVNGRDERRAQLGFKGNLTLDEAIALCKRTDADLLIPCHFGMFALNDIPQTLTSASFNGVSCMVAIPKVQQPLFCMPSAHSSVR